MPRDPKPFTCADLFDELLAIVDEPDPGPTLLRVLRERREAMRVIDRDCERLAEIRKLVGGMP